VESFTLTRHEMACLLLALDGYSGQTPLQVLQEAWNKKHRRDLRNGNPLPAFLSTALPPIFEKLIKGGRVRGFSLQEIAALGGQIEYAHLSPSSMQNWVKRDFKEYFGSPKAGKKYSLNQAALLFIIDDLKSNLDFDSIRKLFAALFRKPEDEQDDLLGPLELYEAYSSLFEEWIAIKAKTNGFITLSAGRESARTKPAADMVRLADRLIDRMSRLSGTEREVVRNSLLVAAISVLTCYLHATAKQYLNATLFLTP
jgi:Domain of unknown function (DUF1836).